MQQASRGLAAASIRLTALWSSTKASTSAAPQLSRSVGIDGVFHNSMVSSSSSQSKFQHGRWISQLVSKLVGAAGSEGWRRSAAVNEQSVKLLYAVPVRLASMAPSVNGRENKKWRFSAIFLFLPCVATFGLGTWQLFRRQWKIEVLDYRRKRLEEEPIPLVTAIASAHGLSEAVDQNVSSNQPSTHELEFRTVICEGVYDEKNNLYVGPRARSAFGVTQKGYFVITPLSRPDDSKSVQVPVLVNRGWVPSAWLEESASRQPKVPLDTATSEEKVGQVPWWKFWTRQHNSPDNKAMSLSRTQSTVTVHGVIRNSEQPNMFVPSNVPSTGQWFYVDVPAMAHALGLPENAILIEVVQEGKKSEGREIFPVAKDPEALLHSSVMPQDHINYALTWYTLSAATTFMAVKRVRGLRRGQ